MKIEVSKVPLVPGLTNFQIGDNGYTLTAAQAAALEAFCNCSELGDEDAISLAWGQRAGVEIARCSGSTYTVLFTSGTNVNGATVDRPVLRQIGRMLSELRETEAL